VFVAAASSARWVEAIHEVAGADAEPPPRMGGTVAVRFPIDGDPGDDGWHIDGSYVGPDGEYWVNARSEGRALLMLVLLSDVGDDDGPTRIRVGSHHDIPDALAPYGEAGVASLELALPERVHARPLALATGRAGDVYLCHPFLVHAAQRNLGREPRFVAQPGVPWKVA
jgi:ectoine hydroxylase-related dioxygenase (phytanoyl-CoA dioxygenase family)